MARRREFDMEIALDCAQRLFWEQGYEGTSYSDLTAATGVSPSGLYAAFGNKQELFYKAFHRYDAYYLEVFQLALDRPTAREVVETLLKNLVGLITDGKNPPGCFGLNAALACSREAEFVRVMLADERKKKQQLLLERLQRAQGAGDFSDAVDAATMSALVMTFGLGLAVQAKSLTDKQCLNEMIEQFMSGLPFHREAA